MISILHWKKRFFDKTTSIFSAEGKIGYIKESFWSQSAEGEINSRRYTFRTRGFINPYTEITDPTTNYIVGKIEYNSWRNKATLSYLDQSFRWQYDNTWQTRWSITDNHGRKVFFQGNTNRGSIEGTDLSEFQILTGLYVTNYFVQTTLVIFVAIFVPIIASQTR